MKTLLISAGDASGDLHAALFVRAFRAAHPDVRIVGLGGDAMHEAGVELLVHQRELAIGGLFELTRSLFRIAKVWRAMDLALTRLRPDLVVLVDSGGFNIPFAKRVRRRGSAKIFYFVAPQVWAWRPGRIAKLAGRVDRMAVIFPFEPALYADTELPVEFVGHPMAEGLAQLASETNREMACAELGCDPSAPVISLFPGSRRNEIESHLPLQLAVCRLLHARNRDAEFVLAIAPSVSRQVIEQHVRSAQLPETLELHIVERQSRMAMLACDVALAKPGTVTVELSLLARPMVVIGRVDRLTAFVLRRMVRVAYYAMPNLIANREIVPEILQEQAQPETIANAVARLLGGPTREHQLKDLAQVREVLSAKGASVRASEIAGEMLASLAK